MTTRAGRPTADAGRRSVLRLLAAAAAGSFLPACGRAATSEEAPFDWTHGLPRERIDPAHLHAIASVHRMGSPADPYERFRTVAEFARRFGFSDWIRAQAEERVLSVPLDRFRRDVERLGPWTVPALRGIADGADVPFDAVVRAHAPGRGRGPDAGPAGGTTNVLGRLASGRLFLLGVMDDGFSSGRHGALFVHDPDDRLVQVSDQIRGMVLTTRGMNAAGLCLGMAGVVARGGPAPLPDRSPAVDLPFLARHLLETFSTAAEVEAFLDETGYVCPEPGRNLVVLDRSGDSLRAEFAPYRTVVRRPADVPTVACNHFDLMPEEQADGEGLAWSRGRQGAALARVTPVCRDVAALAALKARDGSICRHDIRTMLGRSDTDVSDLGPFDPGVTTQAFAWFPQAEAAPAGWHWKGWPCMVPRFEFAMGQTRAEVGRTPVEV